ncbi:hypothetical protein B0I37DRAFT_366127 [Chaetomium sp. MPI-CAGE-AT-0009]|nr:hypothetical protein B0I37DRAFT_366127 [Chaetomium sp. MPI-CAGE-AT-0009]
MAPVPGILDMAAPTLATVPVHINTNRNRSVADYLAAVQQQAAEMIPFEHAGLQNINRMLPDKTLDLNHLFVIQPFADRLGEQSASLLPEGLEPVPYTDVAAFHAYPLVVECNTGSEAENQGDSVELEAYFDEAILPSDRANAIMERFRHIFIQLRAAASSSGVGSSSTPVAHIDILGPQDIPRIRGWNQWTQAAEPGRDACIHDLVHQQRLGQPDAQAVCAWDGQLTYAELDDLSLRLAHHLVSLGVRAEIPVIMIFEKTLWAVVAQIAILRAGGIIVPVGHNHPLQRVQNIIQATGANVILSSKEYELHHGLVPHVLVLGENLMSRLPPHQPELTCGMAKPTDAAFVIFTSGSTGVPKGVVLEHHSLVASLKAQRNLFTGPAARSLQFAAYTFDVSIAETFIPLISGGCVCVPSEDDRVNNLAAAMETMKVSLANLTPTVAGLLQPKQLASLQTLVFGGEAVTSEAVSRWLGRRVRLFNAYGPAECSICSSARHIETAGEAPSIGTAMAGGNLWVVDPFDHHCLVPVGVPGELLIEGPLLARGYLGDAKKTAAAFVTDPAWLQYFDFGPRQGRRFYRTGDLVRQAPDGSLTYLGRQDTQVKLHGQRLEIGEIEHWFKKVAGARARAAVAGLLARENGSAAAGEPVLAVAVEMDHAEPGGGPTQERSGDQPFTLLPLSANQRQLFGRVRDSLLEALPSYMVPQLYIPVNKLPTTDSGKVDRRAAWAAIQHSGRVSQYSVTTNRTRVAPVTDTERELQQLWAVALRIPPQDIGARDDFFLSGGDSISAMRLVAKAREATRMPLTVADIFQHPVLADVAKVLDARASENALPRSAYRAFSTLGVAEAGPYAAEFIQPLLLEGCHAVDAAPVTDSQALSVILSLRKTRDFFGYITLAGEGPCDIEKWKASSWELVRRHEILRTAYVFVNEQMLQVVLQEWRPDIAHYETDDAAIDGFARELFARDMDRPTCLGRPFIEFAIVTSPSQHRILLRICHADYDAISMSLFFNDLSAIHAGKASSAEPSSFIRDYVSALKGSPETIQKSRSYWGNLLQGASMPRIAPPHQHGPSKIIHHATRSVSLPDRDSKSGKRTTAGTLMRAAWGLTLARYTGMADVTFGEAVSGRSTGQPAAAGAAGCCVNIVPTRIVIHGDASVRELLDAAQAQHVARLPHETVGFRELIGNSGRMMVEDPHFTTRINHLDRPPQWTLRIGDAAYQPSLSLSEDVQDLVDISLTSHSHPDHIKLMFRYREGAMSAEAAEQFMSCLCAVSEQLAATSSESMRLGDLELGPHGESWPVVGNGSVALGIGQPEE